MIHLECGYVCSQPRQFLVFAVCGLRSGRPEVEQIVICVVRMCRKWPCSYVLVSVPPALIQHEPAACLALQGVPEILFDGGPEAHSR